MTENQIAIADGQIRTWRRRALLFGALTAAQLVGMLLVFLLFGGWAETWRLTQDVLFWFAAGSLLVFLLIVIVRYVVLLGAAFLQFQVGEGERSPQPPEELDEGSLPLVSVIVPAYNEEKVIAASIASLLRLDYPRYEVIVVDDGSRDATYLRAIEAAALADGQVRVLTQPNAGKAAALNAGIEASLGDHVFCMDADSTIAPGTLKAMVRHLLAEDDVGAVAGSVKVVNTGRLLTRLQAIEYVQGLNIVRQAMGWGQVVNIIPGPVGMFRKKAMYDVGGYDRDTFAEDCDLTLKLLHRGWRVKYEPEGKAMTEAPETLSALLQQRYRWTRGIIQAVTKHREVLWHPRRNPVHAGVLWYMLFEALLWPIMNVAANLMLLYVAWAFGVSSLMFVWWLMLTALDVAITLLVVGMEEEDIGLVPYAALYRVFFILIVDVCKVFATLEEFLGVGMTWGKLVRLGRI